MRPSNETMSSHSTTGEAEAPMFRMFRAHPSALYEIRQFVRERAAAAHFPPEPAGDLLLAVSEACANSIIHTNSGQVMVSWMVVDGCARVEVLDEGIFKRRVRMPEVEGSGGHGVSLMMALVDEVMIREGTPRTPGTLVRLVKCREP
jgi:anti-sigma regulatory factor (Ser/Thr protein kinase)